MKTSTIVSAVVLLGAVGAGSYWLGARSQQHPPEVSVASAASAPAAAPKQRKLLYYRNPMGLPDTSPTPKKDPMGMDYIPVYEGDETDDGSVKLSPGKIQRTGVKSEPAAARVIRTVIRAPGTIQLDERRSKCPLGAWVEQGHLRRMPGEWHDMAVVEAELDTGAAARDVALAFAFGWAENMMQAAIKSVPLGQTAGQRILARLAREIPAAVDTALSLDDASRQSFSPMLAILSARHEHQYSRLFRS
mgnify:CR=1 FL=1